MEWTFSQHALERAVDMALDPEEIKGALEKPTRPMPSRKYPGRHLIFSERLVFAVNLQDRVVITIGWNTFDGINTPRYTRSVEEDLDRIRDN